MRTGIFGGSFDPPHKGHIEIALAAKKELKLDRIIMVPTGKAPHKNSISANVADRVNMCRHICERYGFELSEYEAEKKENSYTADLLGHFEEIYPEDEFFLIVGGDSLDYMDKWYHPERIFPLATVVVARRTGSGDEKAAFLEEKFGAKIVFLSCGYFDVSSTLVREKLTKGEAAEELLLPVTAEYIWKNKLYR